MNKLRSFLAVLTGMLIAFTITLKIPIFYLFLVGVPWAFLEAEASNDNRTED